MEKSFIYHKPINSFQSQHSDDRSWDKVMEFFKNKQYPEVIRGLVDYVDENLAGKYGNADKTVYEIPHGSVILNLSITDGNFEVAAPFLNIANSKRIPVMRKVAEMNFSPLNLSSIRLEGELLVFRFSSPLELCEPYKVYDALREICIYADSYDDEFIKKFDASWIREPRITPYSDDEVNQAWDHMQEYIREAEEAALFFENKRAFNFAWDVLTITFMRIEHQLQPQGMLRNDIEKYISYMTGASDPVNEKISRGKGYLDNLKKFDRQEFKSNLYRTETFIPFKIRSTVQSIVSGSENTMVQSKKELEHGDYLGAGMTLYYYFFNLFYNNDIPESVSAIAEEALEASSGKSWDVASLNLFKAMQKIVTLNLVVKHEKKGFFKRLFGK